MTNPNVTAFSDPAARIVRALDYENPDTSFVNGANWAASCSSGIGINIGGGVLTGSNDSWTLDDQFEQPRTPQDAGYIGANGLGAGAEGAGIVPIVTARTTDADGNGDLTATLTGDATLTTLATGWTTA
jgi:hypothetical protein